MIPAESVPKVRETGASVSVPACVGVTSSVDNS